MKRTEADLCRVLAAWLTSRGWQVYGEVEHGGCLCDIVAVQKAGTPVEVQWAIEAKLTLTFDVLGQALAWKRMRAVDHVSVAVPVLRSSRATDAAYQAFQALGVGMLVVDGDTVFQRLTPVGVHRSTELVLKPEHLGKPAGMRSPERWTGAKQTWKNLREYVAEHSGCTLGEAVAAIPNHYRGASLKYVAGRLAKDLKRNKVEGVKYETKKRLGVILLWPK